jgi:hypothetical protein
VAIATARAHELLSDVAIGRHGLLKRLCGRHGRRVHF